MEGPRIGPRRDRDGARASRRPQPGWEDSAVPPERLGDYLRELGRLWDRYGYDADMYGHFGQGVLHCRIDFDLRTAAGLDDVPALPRRRRRPRRPDGRLAVRRARRRPGAWRAPAEACSATQHRAARSRRFKDIWDPAGRMNPGKVVRPNPIRRRPPPRHGLRAAAAADVVPASPRTRRRSATRPCRCVGVGECRGHDGGVDVPELHGDPRREALDPRPGPAAVRDAQRPGAATAAGATMPSRRRSTCASPARAARAIARSTSTWRPTRRSSGPTTTRGACARGPPTRWASSTGGPGWRRGRRGWSTPRPTRRCSARLAKAIGGIAPEREIPRFAAADVPAAGGPRAQGALGSGRRPRPRGRAGANASGRPGDPVGRYLHRPLPPGRRPRRRAGPRGMPAARSSSRAPSCAAAGRSTTGASSARRKRLARGPSCATCAPRSGPASRSSGSSRRACRSSATRRRTCSTATRTPGGSPARSFTLTEFLAQLDGYTPPRLDGQRTRPRPLPSQVGPRLRRRARASSGRPGSTLEVPDSGLLRDGRCVRFRSRRALRGLGRSRRARPAAGGAGRPTRTRYVVTGGFSCREQIEQTDRTARSSTRPRCWRRRTRRPGPTERTGRRPTSMDVLELARPARAQMGAVVFDPGDEPDRRA